MTRSWEDRVEECEAKTRQEDSSGQCQLPAGWGTGHPGYGRCKFHGGSTATHQASADRARWSRQASTYGAPREVGPEQAIEEEIERAAGVIEWLQARIDEAADGALPEQAILKIWGEERDRLAKVSKMALDYGMAERQVAIAEEQGRQVAGVIERILSDLRLDADQSARAGAIVRGRLMELAVSDASETRSSAGWEGPQPFALEAHTDEE